jgi:hypothetical protein
VRDARDEVVVAIRGLIDANLETRCQLAENECLLRESLRRMHAGEAIVSILRSLPTERERAANIETVRNYYERRHHLRRATVRAALDEGITIADLADLYAVPVELIASCAATARRPAG